MAASSEGFDLAAALAWVNGDRALLERFLRLFRERSGASIAELAAALGEQNFAAARRHAHGLKGGAGTIGMIALQAAAAALETSLAADDTPATDAAVAALMSAWQQAQAILGDMLDTPEPTKAGEPS